MKNDNYTSDIKSGADYAADKTKSGVDDARSAVKDAANKYGSMADSTIHDVQHTAQQMKQSAQDTYGELESQIRAKPVQATLIAAGVGFLIGALLTR